ncbi:MAG: ATP-binding cassette domain-containing protein [Deltaproteobacteria bacterium]|nr:ATP-binding cassette domain-containing protein [Deltaproteobacteria bacterium]
MAEKKPIITFRGVKKAFGPKVVYRGLDLDVYQGETLTILGGSGVGKSVMLKMLIALLSTDAGVVTFDGREVGAMDVAEIARLRQRVGMVFQSGALFDSISVGENVAYGLREHFAATMNERAIWERVSWALTSVGMPGIEAMRPADLSGGMKKRVGVARTIALQPEVILFDEPTTGLDPVNVTRMNHLIVKLRHQLKVTSIVVTHDMTTAFTVSDRLAFVHKGLIAEHGTQEHFRNCTTPAVRDFIEGRSPEDEMASLFGR